LLPVQCGLLGKKDEAYGRMQIRLYWNLRISSYALAVVELAGFGQPKADARSATNNF
jgi:hypothetical protein